MPTLDSHSVTNTPGWLGPLIYLPNSRSQAASCRAMAHDYTHIDAQSYHLGFLCADAYSD